MTVIGVRWVRRGADIQYENAGWASIPLAPFQRAILIRQDRPWAVAPGRGGFMPKLLRAEKVAIVDIENPSLEIEIDGRLVTKDGFEVAGRALIDFRIRDDPDSLLSYVGHSEGVLQKLADAFLQCAQEVLLEHDLQTAVGKAVTLRSELTAGIQAQVDRLDLPFHRLQVTSLDFEPIDEEMVGEPQEFALRAAEAEANLKIWTELVTRVGEVKDEFDRYLLAAYEPRLLPIVKARAQQKIQELQATGADRAGAAEALLKDLDGMVPDRKKILLGDVWMAPPHAGTPPDDLLVPRRSRNGSRIVLAAMRTLAVPMTLVLAILLTFLWKGDDILALLREAPAAVAPEASQPQLAQEQAIVPSSETGSTESLPPIPLQDTLAAGELPAAVSEPTPRPARPTRRPTPRTRETAPPPEDPLVYSDGSCYIDPRRVPDYGFVVEQAPGKGLVISYLLHGSPAYRAGVRSQDQLHSLEGRAPTSARAAACLAKQLWESNGRFEMSLENEGQGWSVVVRE